MEAFSSLSFKTQCRELIEFMRSVDGASSPDLVDELIQQLNPQTQNKVIPSEVILSLPWHRDDFVKDDNDKPDEELINNQLAVRVLKKFESLDYAFPVGDHACVDSLPDYFRDEYIASLNKHALSNKIKGNLKENNSVQHSLSL